MLSWAGFSAGGLKKKRDLFVSEGRHGSQEFEKVTVISVFHAIAPTFFF